VVVPRDAPAAKVDGARSRGAHIVTYDRHRDDRDEITAGLAAEYGYTIVPSGWRGFTCGGGKGFVWSQSRGLRGGH
jgi:hypothetical protein